jgi:uncharacterized protein YabE (DUF348 family)
METAATAPRPITRLPRDLKAFVALAFVGGALVAGYRATLTPVTLVVDGHERRVVTHQHTIATLLTDAGLVLDEKDRIEPADLDAPLQAGVTVRVWRARPVILSADGHTIVLRTLATSVEEVLREARVSLGPHDEVAVEGRIEAPTPSTAQWSVGASAAQEQPAHIKVHRAIPFTLREDGRTRMLYTTAPTVGEALRRAGLTLYLADGVRPGLGERISKGMVVSVDRSVPVTVQLDGRTLRTRTHRAQVNDVLADLRVVLTGQDYTTPTLEAPLRDGVTIRIIRVTERFLIEQEPIPFESVWQPDPDLEIDNEQLTQEGAPGLLQRRVRVRYEDDNEVGRTIENEYVAVPPTTKIMGYGTKVVVRATDTASGPVEYWRVIRMLATSYSAGTAGVSESSPWYGRTATGMTMRHGIVAVDPRVINLRSNVYVPGYGVGIAGDTGGAIKGRRIDLGYDDDNLILWYRWVDVYLLTPVPAVIDYRLGL